MGRIDEKSTEEHDLNMGREIETHSESE